MATHKYTPSFYTSLVLALCTCALSSLGLGIFNPIHSFVRCFLYVYGGHAGISDDQYTNFCSNSANLGGAFSEITSQWTTINSVNLAMAAVACFFFGVIQDTYGRKVMFQTSLVSDALGLSLIVAFFYTGSFGLAVAGRIFNGFATGGYTLAAPVYLQEIAVAEQKVKFGSLLN